jgi:hypothetical protein
MPEPDDGKLSRPVPRGQETSNGFLLPGHSDRGRIVTSRDATPLQAARQVNAVVER